MRGFALGVALLALSRVLTAGGKLISKALPPMPDPSPDTSSMIHSEAFLNGLMRRQLRLSITCAAAFILLLFGMPLANYFAPSWMAQEVGGFPLSWLILGVLFFPYVWLIAAYFIRKSMALETSEVERVKAASHLNDPSV